MREAIGNQLRAIEVKRFNVILAPLRQSLESSVLALCYVGINGVV